MSKMSNFKRKYKGKKNIKEEYIYRRSRENKLTFPTIA
jgi:hypothetical protein